jgi:putative N6-adenine-specific DNA methylase
MVELLETLANRTGSAPTRLWDPFCGSGVLPLEWLRRRHGVLPGSARPFAFESWPTHQRAAFGQFREEAVDAGRQAANAHAFGSDVDEKAVRSALGNAERSGVSEHATFWQADFRAPEGIPAAAAVLANPPYGKRIGNPQLTRRRLEELADLLQGRADLRPVVLACADPRVLLERGGWEVLARTRHGGVPLAFVGLS